MAGTFANNKGNRRRFLESSAGAAAGMMSLGSARRSSSSPNQKVQIAVIGVRARGRQLVKRIAAHPHATVTALCDIDSAQINRASSELQDLQPYSARLERDYRKVLAAGDIDAVVVATPDHWHAPMCLDALAANKHVFVETPISHTIDETAAIVSAASNSDRIVHCGMQQRSMPHMHSAIHELRNGSIGSIRLARAWASHRRKPIGKAVDGPPPIDVDYDTWLGAATKRPFNPNRFHYSWRWFWDYGGGELTNWGVHMIDIAMRGLSASSRDGSQFANPTISTTGGKYYFNDDQETPDTLTASFDFGDRSLIWEHRQWCPRQIEGRSAGVAFYGDGGTLIVDRGGWKIYDSSEKVAATDNSRGDTIIEDFVDAIRSGSGPQQDLASIASSTDLCHRANLVYRGLL
ncbi:MAG: Gfo/Idh/MocA family protein [Planctomycetaceae bacterium]